MNVDGVMRTLQQRGYIEEVARDPGPGPGGPVRHHPAFLEKLGLDSLDDLPPLGDFVPGADVVEALEHGREPTRRPTSPSTRRIGRCRAGRLTDGPDDGDGERLQKVLARAGIGSRRVCEDLIAGRPGHRQRRGRGRSSAGGSIPRPTPSRSTACPSACGPGSSTTCSTSPPGVVTTADDPRAAPRSSSSCPAEPRVFPVGRLDVDTEGLLLLTNDGDLTHRLTHPSFGVEKEYLAEVEGEPTPAALRRLREGVELDDGLTAPRQAALVGPNLRAHHDPRGPQPPGAAHVRGRRPPGGAAGAHPHRADRRAAR